MPSTVRRLPCLAVIVDQGRRLPVVDFKAAADRRLVVVGRRMNSVRAADVADAFLLRLLEAVVIALAAFGAGIATGDALDQRLVVDLHLDHGVELKPLDSSIWSSASACAVLRGKPSRMKPFLTSGLLEPLGDDRDDDIVGNEFAAIHDRLGLAPDLAARRDRGAQHVAGRELLQPRRSSRQLGLRAFAGARRPEQDDVHRCCLGASRS